MCCSGELLLWPFFGCSFLFFLLFGLLFSLFCQKSTFSLISHRQSTSTIQTVGIIVLLQLVSRCIGVATCCWDHSLVVCWMFSCFLLSFCRCSAHNPLFVDISPTINLDNTNCWHYRIVTVGLSMYWSGNLLLGPFLGCLFDVFLLFALLLWLFCPKSTFSLISHRHSSLTIQTVGISIQINHKDLARWRKWNRQERWERSLWMRKVPVDDKGPCRW